ncbi:hypothetical protein M2349_001658 [Caldanaerobacter subterraneus subsp. tengcongensis MB4]|nr:hypothetical protein [Caldanaerobacter subterraneus]MCS3916517.1 hypothetical protein [Caldanaerobacter subterraneus subsp. tengcongensis MB4]
MLLMIKKENNEWKVNEWPTFPIKIKNKDLKEINKGTDRRNLV